MAYDKYAYQNKQIEMYRKALLDAQDKIKELENRIQVVARLNNVTIDEGGNVRTPGGKASRYILDEFDEDMNTYAKRIGVLKAALAPDLWVPHSK